MSFMKIHIDKPENVYIFVWISECVGVYVCLGVHVCTHECGKEREREREREGKKVWRENKYVVM